MPKNLWETFPSRRSMLSGAAAFAALPAFSAFQPQASGGHDEHGGAGNGSGSTPPANPGSASGTAGQRGARDERHGDDGPCRPRRIRGRFRASRSVPASTPPPSCATSTAAGPALSPTAWHCASGTSWRWTRTLKSPPASVPQGMELQRPHPRPYTVGPGGRCAAYPLHERRSAPPHNPLPRHPPGHHGMTPGIGAGFHRPRAKLHQRIQPHPLRHTRFDRHQSPTGPAHREGSLRRLHHRAQGGPARRPTTRW